MIELDAESNIELPRTRNVEKAKQMLSEIDPKIKLVIRDICELGDEHHGTFGGGSTKIEEVLFVHLNPEMNEDMMESTFVHEVIHELLSLEGFPEGYADFTNIIESPTEEDKEFGSFVAGLIISAIQHPEVYQRMEEQFDLNMNKFFESQFIGKKELFSSDFDSLPHDRWLLQNQQEIAICHECFYYSYGYDKYALSAYRKHSKDNYRQSLGIMKRIEDLDSSDVRSCFEIGRIMLDRIISYGHARNGQKFNNYWKAVQLFSRK